MSEEGKKETRPGKEPCVKPTVKPKTTHWKNPKTKTTKGRGKVRKKKKESPTSVVTNLRHGRHWRGSLR